MKKSALRKNTNAYQFLLVFWTKHCELKDEHKQWAIRYITLLRPIRGQVCYHEADHHKMVYLVTRGTLARVKISEVDDDDGLDGYGRKTKYKRRILSIATPGMALTTTRHLFSNTPSKGDIVALHANTVVLAIPYSAIRPYIAVDPCVTILSNILVHKKKKQQAELIYVMQSGDGQARVRTFQMEMRELYHLLSYQERADFIGVSLKTVKRFAANQLKS